MHWLRGKSTSGVPIGERQEQHKSHAPATISDDLLREFKDEGSGRRPAVELLYNKYAGPLRGYFVRHGVSPSEAEDLTQDTFVRVIREAGTFRGDAQFSTWLWVLARNVMIDAWRRRGATGLMQSLDADGFEEPVDPGESPHRQVERAELVDCVRRRFGEFAARFPQRAQALIWVVSEKMTSSQIAEIIGRSAGATREYLSQSRKKLNAYLEPCLGE